MMFKFTVFVLVLLGAALAVSVVRLALRLSARFSWKEEVYNVLLWLGGANIVVGNFSSSAVIGAMLLAAIAVWLMEFHKLYSRWKMYVIASAYLLEGIAIMWAFFPILKLLK